MRRRTILLLAVIAVMTAASTRLRADSGSCGGQMITLPFTDVSGSVFFCSIAEAYFSGLTNGTDATHYSPTANVTRDQMAAFITRTLDSELRRGSLKAALDQWGDPSFASAATTNVDSEPAWPKSDGADIWVPSGHTISRVRASDGRLLETWTGAGLPFAVLVARGRIFIVDGSETGHLYRIDPKQPPGDVSLVTNAGSFPRGVTTDGTSIWVANSQVVRKIDPGNGDVTIVSGFDSAFGMLYDGSNVWVTEDHTVKKLAANGNVLRTITVDPGNSLLGNPTFDGINIWVGAAIGDSVVVIRAKDSQGNSLSQPFLLATLTGNGLDGPVSAAFDGERILVTNINADSVSLWKASSMEPLGSVSLPAGSAPYGACSDGVNFWVTLKGTNKLVKF
jgi:S-layer family protein